MPKFKGKIRYLNPGDLVVIRSPHMLVTHNGHVKNQTHPEKQSVTGHVKTPGDWEPVDIPYETHAVLIDARIPLIMMDEKIVMVPRSCIQRCKDE